MEGIRTYECEGCETRFTGTATDAFNVGWDTPERFLSHCTCPTCPITVTAWWKAVVDHQPLTVAEVDRIWTYNRIHDHAHAHDTPPGDQP